MKRKDGAEFPVEIRLRKLELVNSAGKSECRILAMVRDITEVRRAATSLEQARKKMNLLNSVTFQDIQSAVFSISAYQVLIKQIQPDQKISSFLDEAGGPDPENHQFAEFCKELPGYGDPVHPARETSARHFSLPYPTWTFYRSLITLRPESDVYADPLLEKVFYNLMENVIRHGSGAQGPGMVPGKIRRADSLC